MTIITLEIQTSREVRTYSWTSDDINWASVLKIMDVNPQYLIRVIN